MSSARFAIKKSSVNSKAIEYYNAAMKLLSLENPGLSNEDIHITNLMISNSDKTPEEWLLKAANLNYLPAMLEYAIYLLQYQMDAAGIALDYLKRALKAGCDSPLLFCELGNCAFMGLGMPVDEALAKKYLEEGIKKINALQNTPLLTTRLAKALVKAQSSLGGIYHTEVSDSRKKQSYAALSEDEKEQLRKLENRAITILAAAENAGSLSASHYLATIYLEQSNDINHPSGRESRNRMLLQKMWLHKIMAMAEKGYCHAEYDLANYYHHSKQIPDKFVTIEDKPQEATKLYWRAAIHGKPQAYSSLLNIYTLQNNFPMRNLIIALGAHVGVPTCQYEQSIKIMVDPNVTAENKKLAMSFIKEIADTDIKKQFYENPKWYVDAQCRYALFCLEEFENQNNHKSLLQEAIIYFRKAVTKGHIQAKFFLANALINYPEEDFERSFKEAEKLIQELKQTTNTTKNPGIADVIEQLDNLHSRYQDALLEKRNNLAMKKLAKSSVAKTVATARTPQNIFPNNTIKKSSSYALLRQRPSNPVAADNSVTSAKTAADMPETSTMTVATSPSAATTDLKTAVNHEVEPELTITMNAEEVTSPPKTNPYAVVTILPHPLANEVIGCLKALVSQGYVAYVVGGMVRNNLSGLIGAKDDADIITNAPIEMIESIAMQKRHEKMPDVCRYVFNHIQFDIKSVSDLQNHILRDAMSRDFTINALYANIDHQVLDPTGKGLQDLFDPACQLKSITSHSESFAVDPFRILRYLKFRASGLLGDITFEQMAQYLKEFRELFKSFKKTAGLSEDEKHALLQKGSLFNEKLDFMLCHLLMSGQGARIMQELLAYNFFENFYAGVVLDAPTRAWLIWRFEAIDEFINYPNPAYPVTKIKIYEILLAAMLNLNEEFSANFNHLFDNHPLPVALRWKTKPASVATWFNDRKYFSAIPNKELLENLRTTNFRLDHETLALPAIQGNLKYAALFPVPVYQGTTAMSAGYSRLNLFNHPNLPVPTYQPPGVSLRV